MKFRGILFDKDGTLIESDGTWIPLYRRMLMRMKAVDEAGANALLALAGYDPATDRMLGGSVLAGGTTRQLVEIWWPGESLEGIEALTHLINNEDKEAADIAVKAIVDLVPVFDRLHAQGLKLGVATNDGHTSAKRHMEQLGISHYFDAIIAADTVAVPKPSGDMIRKFAEVTGISPHEIIMVGDNHHDMDEAVNGGAGYRVAVLSGNGAHEHLAHLADVTLDDISHLPEHLEGLRVL